MLVSALLERDFLPDTLIRQGIRRLLHQRLRDESKGTEEAQKAHELKLIEQLRKSPIAVQTQAANEQHYEIPAEFYRHVLGKYMKYSCGYWAHDVTTLDESEEAMLRLTCTRA